MGNPGAAIIDDANIELAGKHGHPSVVWRSRLWAWSRRSSRDHGLAYILENWRILERRPRPLACRVF